MSSTSNYNTLKVAELTELCKKRGLSGTGTKAVLVARLKKYDEENQNKVDTNIKKDEEDEVNVDDTDNLDVVGTDQTSTAPKTVATTGASSKSQTSAPTTQTQTTVSKEISDNNATTPNASNTQQQETTDTQPVDEETRKKMRAERFKIPLQESEANKAFQRAARFGLPVKGTKADQTVRQNKNLPAQLDDATSVQKKAQRAERFGKQVFAVKPPTHADRLQQRQQRFGNKVWSADEQEKKRKRAERFNLGADKKIKTA